MGLRRRTELILWGLLVVLAIIWGTLSALERVGVNWLLYARLQAEANVAETSGISEDDLIAMDIALSDCLKGDSSALETLEVEALLIPLGAFALWAAIDFSGAFTFFHHLLFANDLWLLDPRTDLLIRICPSSMFASMGLRIGARALLWMVGAPAAACGIVWLIAKVKESLK